MTVVGYRFDLDCRRCGGPLEHVADGNTDGVSTRAVARCQSCHTSWIIAVTVAPAVIHTRPATERHPAECGTDAGYHAHRRTDTPVCPACRDAHATAERHRRALRRGDRPIRRERVGAS